MTVTTEAAERLMKRCHIGVRYSQKNWEEAHEPGSAHAPDLLQRERGRPGEDA